MAHRTDAGLKERTRLAEARERLLAAVAPHGRTERIPIESADGRTLAGDVEARRDVPGYRRAAMDGYAVRAEDTFGAGDRSPAVLDRTEGAVGPNEAVAVHTGGELPEGADAVVMVEDTEEIGDEIEVFRALPVGENVAPVGEDVEAGRRLYGPGHRLRPSDLGLLKSAGHREVAVFARPTVGVIPTGDELVQGEPGPGQTVETNGLTVARYVERWGGRAAYREVVPDDREALRAAIQRDLTRDLVVTTGGSSVGDRDVVPETVDGLGEVFVHGVAVEPGHPVALGRVEGTPVVVLPGYPVSCIVTAVQLLRPALKRAGSMPVSGPPSVEARLDRKIESGPGVRTFARVRLAGNREGIEADRQGSGDGDDEGKQRVAVPVSADGAGVLSSVALADGWVEIPESAEGVPAGETVSVQDWEWWP